MTPKSERIPGKALLGLLHFSAKDSSRPYLYGVSARPDTVAASDGFVACYIHAGLGNTKPVRFAYSVLKAASKPLRKAAHVSMYGDPTDDNGYAEAVTEDETGDMDYVFTPQLPGSVGETVADFPAAVRPLQERYTPQADVVLSIELLQQVAKGLGEMVESSGRHGSGAVRITIYEGEEAPVVFESQLSDEGPAVTAYAMRFKTRDEHPMHEKMGSRAPKTEIGDGTA